MKRTLFVLAFALWLAPVAAAQSSACADCHLTNSADPRLSAFGREHVDAWDHSVHARRNVTCEACHGGDPTTFERARAHRGVLTSEHPASPVNRANLSATCGKCHTGPFVAFQRSRHYQLLRAGDQRGPTCSTCHDDVGAKLLSPSSATNRCNHCHSAEAVHPRPDHGPDAGLFVKQARSLRADLDEAKAMIKQVRDREVRRALEDQYQQAEVPYLEARDAAHKFVFEESRDRLGVSRERTNLLLMRLTTRVADNSR